MSLLRLTFEQQKNMKAIGIAVGVHVLLLLFFLLFTYSMPITSPPEPLGMEVNLGTSESGFGTDQPEATGYPAELANPQQAARAAGANTAARVNLHDLMTSDNEQAPTVNINDAQHAGRNPDRQPHTPDNRRATHNQAANTTAEATQRQPKYTYAGSTGDGQGNNAARNQTGGNEGIGEGAGDMGVPGGTPGAGNYTGVPGGRGNISALVGNRHLVETPKPEATYKEGGKVVVNVTVNREGEIIDYRIKNAANAEIKAIALQKLKHVRFNKAPDARPEMFGTITFDFITR